MFKLKKTDAGIYCFLVTFDLRSHTLNIIDVQAQHEAASIPMQAAAKQTSPERLADPEATASDGDTDSPQQVPVPEVPKHKASRMARSSSTESTESPLITREYRPNDLLSRREAAAYLGISAETLAVWQSTRRYNLPCVKVGRLARYRKADLDAFIQSRTTHKRMETKKHVEF